MGFDLLGRSESALRQGFACGKPLVRRCRAAPLCGAPEGKNKMPRASLIQLQHGHEGLGGQLHGTKGTHLLFARPTKSLDFAGNPSWDLTCSGGVNPPCAKALPAANPLYGAAAPPRCAGPQRAKTRCSGPHSSSFSTAMKASVGSCTVPNVRIFFLPSFCFSSSFFFRLMSPP